MFFLCELDKSPMNSSKQVKSTGGKSPHARNIHIVAACYCVRTLRTQNCSRTYHKHYGNGRFIGGSSSETTILLHCTCSLWKDVQNIIKKQQHITHRSINTTTSAGQQPPTLKLCYQGGILSTKQMHGQSVREFCPTFSKKIRPSSNRTCRQHVRILSGVMTRTMIVLRSVVPVW